MRALVLVLAVVVGGCGVGVAGEDEASRQARPTDSSSGPPAPEPGPGPLAVLHDWDARRAAAWAAADPDLVARLYVDGSRAGAQDALLARSYRDRGFVVSGMRMQVLRARVLVRRHDLIRIAVVDRLSAAVAVRSDGQRISLPRDAPARRTVELRLVDGTWRMARVLAQP